MKHIVHNVVMAILAFALPGFWFVSCCNMNIKAVRVPIVNNDTWRLEGTNYNINSCSHVIVGDGRSYLAINVYVNSSGDASNSNMAYKIAQYGYNNFYKSISNKLYVNNKHAIFMGVDVCIFYGVASANGYDYKGYEYKFSAEELNCIIP